MKLTWKKYIAIATLCVAIILFWVAKSFYYLEITEANSNTNNPHVYNFGVVSFLGNTGDSEQAVYRCLSSAKKGAKCYTFFYRAEAEDSPFYFYFISKVQEIINYFFKPDFIIHPIPSKSYKRNKNIPTYLIINYDILEAFTNPDNNGHYTKYEILKNIAEYDGYILYNLDDKWFKKFRSLAQKQLRTKVSKLYVPNQHSSVFTLEYHPKDFKTITYTGHNWDKLRGSKHYQEIFELLGKGSNFEAYGPSEGWKFASPNYYKGYLPNDGKSVLKTLDRNGISLIFHSDLHHAKNIYSSNRLFEAATVSNLIISDPHPFIKKEFGDCIFYVNPQLKPEMVVSQIQDIYLWAQENPTDALMKAKCAHDIFASKFALEEQMDKIYEMHEKFLAQNH